MAGADKRVSALTLTRQSACSAGLSRDLAPGSIQPGLVLREVSSFKVPSASQTPEYRSKIRPLLSRHDPKDSARAFALRGHWSHKVLSCFFTHSDFNTWHVSHLTSNLDIGRLGRCYLLFSFLQQWLADLLYEAGGPRSCGRIG